MDSISRGTIYFDDLEIGMARHLTKQVRQADIEMFAEVTTDHNPVHLNDDYAQGTFFKGRIAHGMLSAGLISAVIGEQLPGHGSIYLSQSLQFLAPVRIGDLLRAEARITALDPLKRRVTLETLCSVGKTVVVKGEAVVLAPHRKADAQKRQSVSETSP